MLLWIKVSKIGLTGMIRAIEEEKPQVVVVGRYHADFIKKRYPSVHYVAFKSEFIEDKIKPPFRSDEVIVQ